MLLAIQTVRSGHGSTVVMECIPKHDRLAFSTLLLVDVLVLFALGSCIRPSGHLHTRQSQPSVSRGDAYHQHAICSPFSTNAQNTLTDAIVDVCELGTPRLALEELLQLYSRGSQFI
jgi:hypothetical protein